MATLPWFRAQSSLLGSLVLARGYAWHADEVARAPGNSLSFPRSNRRVVGSNLSHIDRWYVDEWASSRGGTIGILAGTTLLDHAQ